MDYNTFTYVYYVLCSKTYNNLGGLFWSPVGSRRAARGTRIYETRDVIVRLLRIWQLSHLVFEHVLSICAGD